MISITPQGQVYLCKTKLEADYKNQLTFSNKQAQETYFNSTIFKSYSDYTYIKKDNVINVNENIDSIIGCNYLFYRNTGFTNDTYYCFIVNMEYVNENCTRIYIETDVWQTYQFSLTYNASFVEREHTNDDTIGNNTYPENVETGEYIVNSVYVDSHLDEVLNDTCYILGANVDIMGHIPNDDTKWDFTGGNVYNGVYSGVNYYRFDRGSTNGIDVYLKGFAKKGQVDTITGLFIIPKFIAPINTPTTPSEVSQSSTPASYNLSFTKTYGLQGYIPRNNKMYTYPFCYVLGNNMAGTTNIYRYEDFSNTDCTFTIKGVICPSGSIRCTPTNYKGISSNDNESLLLAKYPICNYSVDMYTNWLTQNSVNIGGTNYTTDDLALANAEASQTTGFLKSISNMFSNIKNGNVGGGIGGIADLFQNDVSSLQNIGNAMIAKKQHSLIPPSTRGDLNAGDVLTADSKNNFRFYRMSIKQEYASKIDKFFDMFGYATNIVKTPNITGRRNWNYVKTLECNFEGNIPQVYLQKIRGIFNNGITLWHNPETMLDYSQNNDII